jgi:nucleotidyltransferase substrate binding protein (TIGR01987 family)
VLLDLTSLNKAITSLENAIMVFDENERSSFDAMTKEVIKAGLIQNFEFTYELSHKMLKRYLELTEPNSTVIEEMNFADLIRKGYEKGLLPNSWDIWKDYRKARGITSHTYDADKASEVIREIPQFIKEAHYLYAELEKRNG